MKPFFEGVIIALTGMALVCVALTITLQGVTWNVNVPGVGKVGTDNLSKYGFWHDFIYGNPNKREWSCKGKCPAEVLRIAAEEDARHRRENAAK